MSKKDDYTANSKTLTIVQVQFRAQSGTRTVPATERKLWTNEYGVFFLADDGRSVLLPWNVIDEVVFEDAEA